jgi:glycosyltransferase involved in cell wall biosynthesis
VPVHARRRAAWAAGEQLLLPRLAARHGIDLLHSLGNFSPLRGGFRRVVTLHDLRHRRLPEAVPFVNRVATRVLLDAGARRSHRILTGSAASASDIETLLGIDARRIDTTAYGVAAPGAATPGAALRESLGLGDRRIVLSAGLRERHKNHARLVEALGLLEPAERPLLVICGRAGPDPDPLQAEVDARGLQDDVRLEGWLPSADLEGLYALADAVVHPSLFEGFGLPVLEAMRRGVPVACSDIPVLREVAGDDALRFDPGAAASIADALRRLHGDRALRERLREAGLHRAARYTWERTAHGTLASYELALRS